MPSREPQMPLREAGVDGAQLQLGLGRKGCSTPTPAPARATARGPQRPQGWGKASFG